MKPLNTAAMLGVTLFLASALVGASLAGASPLDGTELTARAAESPEMWVPLSVTWVAVGAVACLLVLSFLSAGEGAPGADGFVRSLLRGARAEDLFVRVQLIAEDADGRRETAFLRQLDRHHAALMTSATWNVGTRVLVSTKLSGRVLKTSFRGKIKRCRRLTADQSWFLLRLEIDHAPENEDHADHLRRDLAHEDQHDLV